jgi:hypothetical protein
VKTVTTRRVTMFKAKAAFSGFRLTAIDDGNENT